MAFSCFLLQASVTINFPLRTAFAVFLRVESLFFHFSCISKCNFLFDLFIDRCLFSYSLDSSCLYFFVVFSCSQFLVSYCYGQNFIYLITIKFIIGLSKWPSGKEAACRAGDKGLILGSGRSLGVGNGNPLQYSCLENSVDRGAWWATVHGIQKS